MTRISQLLVQGDSLSDRGTLDERKLLGFIPMSYLSGLSSKSPKGRFTNGYLWGDFVSATTAEEFEINHVRRKLNLKHDANSNADVSDEFLTNSVLINQNKTAFNLNDDNHVFFKGERFARYYCEGGLTSYDYSSTFTIDPSKEVSRLILATLEDKRKQLLRDDKKYHISKLEKKETLVIEWSGANDLITANTEPTHKEADDAVNERIKNIEQLIQNGYRNFVLFNLPNLSLTPRYQAKNKTERDNAAACSEYFNTQLTLKCIEIDKKYKKLHIPINLSIFDVDAQFKEVYNHPEQYGFDAEKLKSPFTQSVEFEKNKQNPEYIAKQISPSEGYMFWDDVHPTADMHHWLACQFKEKYGAVYEFIPPQHLKKTTQEDSNIQKKSSRFFKSHPNSAPKIKLPEDVLSILEDIHTNAKSMCKSSNPNRREKGELLKQFLFELKCQKGSLEDIHGFISSFTMDTQNMVIIKTHNNPIFDFLIHKTTTRSENSLKALTETINTHLTDKRKALP